MKILNESTKQGVKSLSTCYDFDKLNSLDDVINIIKLFESTGVNINNIYVKEFGGYEDNFLRLGYDNVEELKKVVIDFENKQIEKYEINGEYDDTKLGIGIFPDINRMLVRYQPKIKEELKNMFETKINSNADGSKINSIQHL